MHGDGNLWHAVLDARQAWSPLRGVGADSGAAAGATRVAVAQGVSGEAQVVFATREGRLWHTLRDASGAWSGVGDVGGQVALPGPVTELAAALDASGEAWFVLTTRTGGLWCTTRRADGSWSKLIDLGRRIALRGDVASLAATVGPSGTIRVVFTTSEGLWSTERRTRGAWAPVSNLGEALGLSSPVATLALAGGLFRETRALSATQLVFTTHDGGLWHALQGADGAWSVAGDVGRVVALPGPVGTLTATLDASGEARFVFLTRDNGLWCVSRHPDGSWSSLEDVGEKIPLPGAIASVAAVGAASGETHLWLTSAPW
jgi:hypothetical protein